MDQPQSHLLRLPQELIVCISRFLTTPELLPLRQSCKWIEKQLFSDFASTFFSKRQFMVEYVSLEALLGIANHPGLAAYLGHVIISTHVWFDSSFPTARRRRVMPHRSFVQTGIAREMLSQALSKLPNLHTIGFRDYEAKGRTRDGPDARWRAWGWTQHGEPSADIIRVKPTEVFPMILAALDQSQATPDRMEVILRRGGLLDCESFTYHSRQDVVPTPPWCSRLKHLILAVDILEKHGLSPDQASDILPPLENFLIHTVGLETLRLNFEPTDEGVSIFLAWLSGRVLDSSLNEMPYPQLPNLHTLELGKATVDIGCLVQVLTRFDLTAFSLWEITLSGTESSLTGSTLWSEALDRLSRRISATSRLETIMIGRPRQAKVMSETRFGISMDVRFELSDESKAGSVKHLDRVEFSTKHTNIGVHRWLQEMASATVLFVYAIGTPVADG